MQQVDSKPIVCIYSAKHEFCAQLCEGGCYRYPVDWYGYDLVARPDAFGNPPWSLVKASAHHNSVQMPPQITLVPHEGALL